MLHLYLRNICTGELQEYSYVLAAHISPSAKELSFCVRLLDGSISEVKRFALNDWEILCT